MLKKKKILLFLLIIMFFSSVSLAIASFYLFGTEKNKRVALEKEIKQNIKLKAKLEDEIDLKDKEISRLTGELSKKERRIIELGESLGKENQEKQTLVEKTLELQRERDRLSEEKLSLQKEVSGIAEKLASVTTQLTKLSEENKKLEEKVASLNKPEVGVELDKIIVTPTEKRDSPLMVPIEGKIKTVNKNYGFLVVDLGKANGVKVKDIFSVYRENQFLGQIKIERVLDALSIAQPMEESQIEEFKEGDRVVSQT